MTTLISFATRDCLVVGCDSLATSTKPMIDFFTFYKKYFNDAGKVLKDNSGNILLEDNDSLRREFENIPYNQLPNVTKLYQLKPAIACVMFAGLSIVGDKSIRNLIDSFLSETHIKEYLNGNYYIRGIATRLKKYIQIDYNKTYESWDSKPSMEILVSGYTKNKIEPEIFKIKFGDENPEIITERKRGEYGIVFGGQNREIMRFVRGLDVQNLMNYYDQITELFDKYIEYLNKLMEKRKIIVKIKHPRDIQDFDLYDFKWIEGLHTDYDNFSDQAAIDFVDFLVDIMVKAQQFSNRLPTVGGNIHLALMTKSNGFSWISHEAFTYKGREVLRNESQ